MDRKFELSSVDMMTFIIQGILGVRILTLPRDIAIYAGNDSWISVFMGAVIIALGALMLYWLGIKYPGQNGSQIVESVFGRYIGKIGLISIAVHTLGSVGLSMRSFGNSIRLYLLNQTPMYVIVGIMLLLGLYAFLKGIKTITVLVNILLPPILFFTLILLSLSINRIDWGNALPILYDGVKPVMKGALKVVDAFYGVTIISYIMPYFREPKKARNWIFVGIAISTFVTLSIVGMCVLVFGGNEMKWLVYPSLSLVKSIQLKVRFLERAESLFMAIWIVAVFVIIFLTYFVSFQNLKVLFKTSRDSLLIYGQLPIIALIIILPQNAPQLDYYGYLINQLGRAIMLVIVPLAVVITLWRERKKA